MRGRFPCRHESSSVGRNTNSQCYVTSRNSVAVSQRPAATTGSAGSATAWWRRRFDEEGVEGLVDRSSVPHHQPTKTDPEGTEKILWLRQQYHFGPPRISMYLVRYHDVTISPPVWRILHKLGLNRLPASQRYTCTQTRRKRYEKQCPATNCRWTCIFIEPLAQTRKRREEALLPSALQSMTARDCGSCAPIRAGPARSRSNSSTTPSRNCRPKPSMRRIRSARCWRPRRWDRRW